MGSQFDNKVASLFKDFGVRPSQLETALSIFERHPNLASEFPKNHYARSFYMGVLLNLTEAMSQWTPNISKGDLADANAALALLTSAGLNLKWLEEKLEELSESKEIAETGEKRVQE